MLTGSVIDQATSLPVSGATVTLTPAETTTQTTTDGSFYFAALTVGTYSITITKTGYQTITKGSLVVSSSSSATANILLPTSDTALNITSTVLTSAVAGTAYSARVMVAGGTAPYTFSKLSGTLPTGLTLDATTGVISGTPSGTGSYTIVIKVIDSASGSSSKGYVLDLVAPLSITTTTLNRTVTGTTYPVSISASGGKTAYTFTVSSGTLPTGLTLSTAGAFTGTPSTTGDYPFTITVTDSTGRTATKNLSLGVDAPLLITTTRLNDAKQGVAYSFTPAATGGYGTKSWSLFSGTLPAGLTFETATGAISGTPTEAVTRIITLMVTDSYSRTYFKSYPLNVTIPVGFTTTRLPNAYAGSAYSERIQGKGGIPPYSYSMSGSLPSGLTFSNGTVSGTYNSFYDQNNISVTITDSSYPTAQTSTQSFSILATNYYLTPTTSAVLANARKGTAITTITFAAAGGKSPYTWSHIGGALPGGITFNPATATLSGTPTDAGDFSFTLHLADSGGNTTGSDPDNPDKTFVLHVSDILAVDTATLPSASLNVPYSTTLTSRGGLKPITWSVASGTLPTGITLDATTGQLSGTPTSSATASFTVRTTDSESQTATKAFTFPVSSTMTITETTLPAARLNTTYSANVRAQNGITPYNWSIESGSLPAGIALSVTNGIATLSGTPTAAGTATFALKVTDSTATPLTATTSFTLTTLPTLAITTTTLPGFTTGQSYTQSVAVSGGQTPYSYSISSGSLPAGLYLNSASGVISGTSSATGGSSFTVTGHRHRHPYRQRLTGIHYHLSCRAEHHQIGSCRRDNNQQPFRNSLRHSLHYNKRLLCCWHIRSDHRHPGHRLLPLILDWLRQHKRQQLQHNRIIRPRHGHSLLQSPDGIWPDPRPASHQHQNKRNRHTLRCTIHHTCKYRQLPEWQNHQPLHHQTGRQHHHPGLHDHHNRHLRHLEYPDTRHLHRSRHLSCHRILRRIK